MDLQSPRIRLLKVAKSIAQPFQLGALRFHRLKIVRRQREVREAHLVLTRHEALTKGLEPLNHSPASHRRSPVLA